MRAPLFIQKLKYKLKPYRGYLSPLVIIGGFIIDTFTLNRIDQVFDNLILVVHLLIVATAIALLHRRHGLLATPGLLTTKRKWGTIYHIVMMFSFGGLFSGFTIFYAKSAGWISAWIFVLVLLSIMLSAEYYQQYFERAWTRVSIFVLALYLYVIFAVPVVIGRMGLLVFFLATVLTIILAALYLQILKKINPAETALVWRQLKQSIGFTIGLIVLLYLFNLVPPVPLAMQFKAPYYEVRETTEFVYRGVYESAPWYKFDNGRSHLMIRPNGERIYVFTSIFAPTRLRTSIIHQWQHYDEIDRSWVTSDEIVIPITGGRGDGFRGFSYKTNHQEGKWRVRVLTKKGQIVGTLRFDIEHGPTPLELTVEEL